MGLRFRRRIKLFPGVSVNISKSGISTSVGRSGSILNLGKRGTRATVGLPGTGISYSERLSGPSEPAAECKGVGFGTLLLCGLLVLFVGFVTYAIFSG